MWNTDTLKKARFPPVTNASRCGRPDGWLHYLHPLTADRRFRLLHMFSSVIWNDIRWVSREAYRLRPFPLSLPSLWKVAYCLSDESWRSFVSRSLISAQPASDNKVWSKYTETDYGFYKKLRGSKSVSSYVSPSFFS